MIGGSASELALSVALFVTAAVVAWRRGAWQPLRLQGLVGIAAAAGLFATSRISDVPFWYLIRWSWAIAMWWWVAIVWSLVAGVLPRRAGWVVSAVLVSAALAVSVNTAASVRVHVPNPPDQAAMRAMIPRIVAALGHQDRVRVQAANPHGEAMARGVALQLEKHGIRLAVSEHDVFRFGRSRLTAPGDASTVLVVAAGDAIETLQRVAASLVPPQVPLRRVASFGTHPTNTVAVFAYDEPQ